MVYCKVYHFIYGSLNGGLLWPFKNYSVHNDRNLLWHPYIWHHQFSSSFLSVFHLLDNLISIRILTLIRMFAEFKQSACCFLVGRSGMQKIGSGRATRMPTPGLDYDLKKYWSLNIWNLFWNIAFDRTISFEICQSLYLSKTRFR